MVTIKNIYLFSKYPNNRLKGETAEHHSFYDYEEFKKQVKCYELNYPDLYLYRT